VPPSFADDAKSSRHIKPSIRMTAGSEVAG
jgi:hypothetical protein